MNFNMVEAIELLERTPQSLQYFLTGLSDQWLQSNEGESTWNASEIIEHLIECEKLNWIPRLEFILQQGENEPFPPFDRFSHLQKTERSLEEKFREFTLLRNENIKKLKDKVQSEKQLEVTGLHPDLGVVKIREVISTWVVHDLTHISQIVRVMADRYSSDVGPWKEYLSILKK